MSNFLPFLIFFQFSYKKIGQSIYHDTVAKTESC